MSIGAAARGGHSVVLRDATGGQGRGLGGKRAYPCGDRSPGSIQSAACETMCDWRVELKWALMKYGRTDGFLVR